MLRRRGALAKKSRRFLTEDSPDEVYSSVNDVRLTMFRHGNSVRMRRRHNSRNEERSPLKSVAGIAGPRCGEHSQSTSIVKDSRRGAEEDSLMVISWIFSGIP